jgi:methionyl-tRNA formyltransferase
MKIAILTTQTPHHVYFVKEIAGRYPDVHVIDETQTLHAPFESSHSFEADRDERERGQWFGGRDARLADFASVTAVDTLNSADGLKALAGICPDIAIVFGTGKLSPEVIDRGPRCLLNLHGGDPEEYRGLDTHLWAIYHGDFGALITTLHRVNSVLDDGDICLQESLQMRRGMLLSELRTVNTIACVRLAIAALESFKAQGDVPGRRQRHKGRYYSYMPGVLKDLCVRRFARHTGAIEDLAGSSAP